MKNVLAIAMHEIHLGMRNRWVVATTVLLAALSLSMVLLGSAPTGTVKADPMAVVVVSLASLTIFLVPLIALLLSFDAIVGEHERGTLLLLLAYPVRRWEVVVGKALGQSTILAIATVVGYGAAALALWWRSGISDEAWQAYLWMIASSAMLGAAFVSIGVLASTLVRDRATAAGIAIGVWLFFVMLFDSLLLGWLVADQGALLGERGLAVLLLLNPTDTYRLFNMATSEAVSVYSGMAGPGDARALPGPVYLAVLAAWIIVPLLLAILAFRRRAI